MSSPDGWNAILLDRRRDRVLGQSNVLRHGWVETGVFKLLNGHDPNRSLLEHINLRDPDDDVSWLFFGGDGPNLRREVNAMTRGDGVWLTEELSLELWVLRAQVSGVAVELIQGCIAVPIVGRIVRVIICRWVRPAIRRLRDVLDHRGECDRGGGIGVDGVRTAASGIPVVGHFLTLTS
jgi:hypothetical protein